ncbi:MAG: GGDEF domain-containing protein [Proteobacteria bacterium]|nr:GGDEF domain-containing protein [Pseudomonadota bacterium]
MSSFFPSSPLRFAGHRSVTIQLALLLLVLLLAGPGAVSVAAQSQAPTLYLSDATGTVSLGTHLEFLKDTERTLSVAEIASKQMSQRFLDLKTKTLFLDDPQADWWLKVSLNVSKIPQHLPQQWVVDAGWPEFWDWYALKAFDVYLIDDSGEIHLQRAFGKGSLSPFIHQLNFLKTGNATLLIHVQSELPVFLPVTLFSIDNYLHSFRLVSMAKALACGILLAMGFFHFVLYLCIRDKAYAWYSGFIISSVLYLGVQTGLMREFAPSLWSPGLGMYLDPALLTVFSLFFLQFTRIFLATRTYTPNHDRLLQGIILSGVIWLGLLPFLSVDLVNALTLVFPLSCIYSMLVAVISKRRGFYPANHFTLAFSPYILGGPVALLTYMGIFEYSPLMFYLLPGMALLSVLLFPYALTRRLAHLRIDQGQMQRKKRETDQRAMTDSLTGLPNIRLFQNDLVQYVQRADQQDSLLSFVLLDVDDFKRINHVHGPILGDEVLKALGRAIRVAIRESDRAYRYGGEEFCLLLPGSTSSEGAAICERIRDSLKDLNFATENENQVKITVSAGIAKYASAEGPDSLLFRTSKAMYRAKADGKDCVVVAT